MAFPPNPIANGDLVLGGPLVIEVGPAGAAPVTTLVLPVSPDQQITYDIRATLHQTLLGAYTDRYGLGVPGIVLSGNTAWQASKGSLNGQPVNGPQAARALYRDVVQKYESLTRDVSTPHGVEMVVHDEANKRSWLVEPMPPFRVQQTNQDPLVTYFTLTLIVIADLTDGPMPANLQVTDQVAQMLATALQQVVQQPDWTAPFAVSTNAPSMTLSGPVGPSSSPTSPSSPSSPASTSSSSSTASTSPPTVLPSNQAVLPGNGVVTVAPSVSTSKAATDTSKQKQTPKKTYVVQAGDTLWSIAKNFLNDGHRWRDIVKASRAIGTNIANASMIVAGVTTLVIPDH